MSAPGVDEAPYCPKCGGTDVSVRYHQARWICPFGAINKTSVEHLHYKCRRCGYDWIGPTMDGDAEVTP